MVVPPQERKPYSFGGRFFIRDGASSQQMSNEEVENLFYAVGRLHFDKKPCEIFSMETTLMTRLGRGLVNAPKFQRPWIGSWPSETSA